jgi:hypothetical protein
VKLYGLGTCGAVVCKLALKDSDTCVRRSTTVLVTQKPWASVTPEKKATKDQPQSGNYQHKRKLLRIYAVWLQGVLPIDWYAAAHCGANSWC